MSKSLMEAFEVEKNKVEQLNLRMRGAACNQQLILSWNPISKNSWLYDFSVVNPPENYVFIHSTYKDNIFLNKELFLSFSLPFIPSKPCTISIALINDI